MKDKTAVYIDGFNLSQGIKSKFGQQYLWLDLELQLMKSQFSNTLQYKEHSIQKPDEWN